MNKLVANLYGDSFLPTLTSVRSIKVERPFMYLVETVRQDKILIPEKEKEEAARDLRAAFWGGWLEFSG